MRSLLSRSQFVKQMCKYIEVRSSILLASEGTVSLLKPILSERDPAFITIIVINTVSSGFKVV